MTIIIKDKDFLTELEKLQDQVNSSQALLAFLINSPQPINNDNFFFYENRYQQQFKKYIEKKIELEEKFIKPNVNSDLININWYLDFKTGELKLDDKAC